MDLDETRQVGLRPEKTKHSTFPAKSRYGFRKEREKMGRRRFVFLSRVRRTTSATFLRSISANFPRTRVQVARDTWFHIPEKFPLRGRISRKNRLFRYFRVPCLCSADGSREVFCDAYTLSIPVDIPQIYPS